MRLSHACHAKAAETKGHRRDTGGTPEGHRRDARAYIRPLGSAHCPTPATQKSHACHAKAAETKGHRRDTGGTPGRTSDPLALHIVPRLPRKSGGDQGTPEGHRRDARAYIRPLGSAHCPTPATQKRRRPRDTGGTPEGRQGVHPTPWQCTLSHACHAKVPRLPRKSGGDQGTPEGRQGVHPTPWQCTLSHACHAKAAETKGHRRDTGGTPRRTSDPLAVHIVPRLPRKSGGDQGTPGRHRRDARAYIRPLGTAHCPTPATQKRRRPRDTGGTPEGRQGVHPTPWQCTLSHACHAKAAETKGHRRDTGGMPGRTSDPLTVHIVPRLPRKSE